MTTSKQWRIATSPSSGQVPFKLYHGESLLAEIKTLPQVGSGWSDEQILRLIHAAPAMLEALKLMAHHWPEQKPDSPAFHAYNQARAAIAQAEGSK